MPNSTTVYAIARPVRPTREQLAQLFDDIDEKLRPLISDYIEEDVARSSEVSSSYGAARRSELERRVAGKWHLVNEDSSTHELAGSAAEILPTINFAKTRYVQVSFGGGSPHTVAVVMDRSRNIQVSASGGDDWTRRFHEWAMYRTASFKPWWWRITRWQFVSVVNALLVALTVIAIFLPAPASPIVSYGALGGILIWTLVTVVVSLRPSFLVLEAGGSSSWRRNVRDAALLLLGGVVGWLVTRGFDLLFPLPPS